MSYLTIREMAAQSGMSEHTLRYYERIGLINPIQRDDSSGHRRYSSDIVGLIEGLSCLRKTGLSIDEMRKSLLLHKQGPGTAAQQKELFLAHQKRIEEEMEILEIRRKYLEGKVAYWSAIENGDIAGAEKAAVANKELSKKLK